MFKIKKSNLTLINIIFTSIFIFGIMSFIIFSLSSFDLDFLTWFSKPFFNSVSMRIYCWTIYLNGNNQVFDLMLIAAMIICEKIYLKISKKYYKTVYIFYTIAFLILITNLILMCYSIFNQGYGFIQGYNIEYFLNLKQSMIGAVIVIVLQVSILLGLFYFINFKLRHQIYFINGNHSIRAIEVIIFTLLTYIILIILKQTTGRNEYLYVKYEDIIGKVEWSKNADGKKIAINVTFTDFIKNLKNVNLEELKQGSIRAINDNKWQPSEYLPWWKINGNFIDNLKFWNPWRFFLNDKALQQMPAGWNVINFPSGHMISVSSLFGFYIMFYYKIENKFNKQKLIFIIIWLFHFIQTAFTLLMSTTHWPTDVFFSFSLGTGFWWITLNPIDKLMFYINKNKIEDESNKID